VKIGPVATSARSSSPKLVPLPGASEDAAATLFAAVETAAPPPRFVPPPAPLASEVMRDLGPQPTGMFDFPEPDAPDVDVVVADALRAIVDDPDSATRPAAVLHQDFAVRCRMAGVKKPPLDPSAFARRLAARDMATADRWTPRQVSLAGRRGLSPVFVGIWDSGLDPKIFGSRLWTNVRETANGRDDDGNGFVDDVHGFAYDLKANRVPELLLPLTDEQKANYPGMRNLTKGLLDVQASIDSPEGAELKKLMSGLKPEAVKPFIEGLNFFGNYTHGTHVAGKARGVRVVNMSWGGSPRDIEGAFEANGAGGTPDERKKTAREYFELSRAALTEAMRGAPEILFVAAAGNSNSDAKFDETIPSGIDLPNVLTVGAVDQAGEETSFTSFGRNVDVHANGFEVESELPGGERLKYSGTSMAAPNVANLAAKLLALRPGLTVAQVTDLIQRGAEKSADGRINLINPKRSVELLRATAR